MEIKPLVADVHQGTSSPSFGDDRSFREAVERVCAVAATHAEAVDRDARFPVEAMDVLRQEGFLGAMVPLDFGGQGFDVSRIASVCCRLAQACSATAMVFAMHQIQVACLIRHATNSPWHDTLLGRIAAEGLLVASVTSEAGVGGQMRRSLCALEGSEGRVDVEKRSTAISYGAYADVFLLTARRSPEAGESDQVLLALMRRDVDLKSTSRWDTLGMRGTCTDGFVIRGTASREQILPEVFAAIASETMVPVSHVLWAAAWLGIAIDAVERTRATLRAQWRSSGDMPASTARFVEAVETVLMLQARVRESAACYDGCALSLSRTADLSALKPGVSEGCLSVVQQCLLVGGFPAYKSTGASSLSRHIRDLQSAALMINNDRIRQDVGRLLMMSRPALGL